jgi:hypothetical protein
MTSGSGQKSAKTVDSSAVASSKIQPGTVQSLDPIASIPSGLQRLLGNDLSSRSPVESQSVSKASNPKASLMAAIQPLSAPSSRNDVSAPNLQLATAQAYTSVPKFSIPGDKVSSRATSKPAVNIATNNRDRLSPSVVRMKNNVAMVSDRYLGMSLRQSWIATTQRNNSLGGLILGSQAMSSDTRKIGLEAPSAVKTSSNGLSTFNPDKFN